MGVTISRYCPLTSRQLWPSSRKNVVVVLPVRQGGVTGHVGDFGWTRTNKHGKPKEHTGVDLLAPMGWPVFAAHAGRITSARESGAAGLRVKLVSDQGEDADGTSPDGSTGTRYCHLDSVIVEPADRVFQGELIAYVGRSGNVGDDEIAVPTHLHFEVREKIAGIWNLIDPQEWLTGVPQARLFADLERPVT